MSLAIGLAGGIHCMGMCGGIIAALAMRNKGLWLPGLTMYHIGRIMSYSALGLAAGLVGEMATKGGLITGIGRILSLFAGAVIILFALQLGGWVKESMGPLAKIAVPAGLIRRAVKGSAATWWLMGTVNGLLPCTMVYAALALALKQGNPIHGAAIMAYFGLGTVPAMTALAVVIRKLSPAVKARFATAAALLLILFGLITIYRGIGLIHMHQT